MRGIKTFLCLLVLACVLSACVKGDQLTETETIPICTTIKTMQFVDFETSPTDTNVNSLITTEYSESDLKKIYEFEGDIHAYNEAYPIECLRKTPVGYRVAYIGESGIAVVWFDGEGKKALAQLHEQTYPVSNYLEIEIGKDLEAVHIMYPDGVYLFLYMGRNDVPRISTHYTSDGYMVHISYDSDYKVEAITTELI